MIEMDQSVRSFLDRAAKKDEVDVSLLDGSKAENLEIVKALEHLGSLVDVRSVLEEIDGGVEFGGDFFPYLLYTCIYC